MAHSINSITTILDDDDDDDDDDDYATNAYDYDNNYGTVYDYAYGDSSNKQSLPLITIQKVHASKPQSTPNQSKIVTTTMKEKHNDLPPTYKYNTLQLMFLTS